MGTVITLPERREPSGELPARPRGPATIIILPVIRIERHGHAPGGDTEAPAPPASRRRRRRTS